MSLGTAWAWSQKDKTCPSDIGYNNWKYYDTSAGNEVKNAKNTLSFTCISSPTPTPPPSECCLDCTYFPNDNPPYQGTAWELNVITNKGKEKF